MIGRTVYRIREIDPGWVARWIVAPLVLGVFAAMIIDPWSPPIIGRERTSAVLLLDGQAYFGRLSDDALSDSLVLRDVYYFQDARDTTTNLQLGLVRRGTEVHQPADGMVIRRDKVLAVETVGASSQVVGAIAADRSLRAPR
jgi:hypothetical protein